MPEFDCNGSGTSYAVSIVSGRVTIRALERRARHRAQLPVDLAERFSSAHAEGIRYVFETDDAWIVLTDEGEFGGGIEWLPRGGGTPRPIVVREPGEGDDDLVPQNVHRAMAVAGELYVLQGLSHMMTSQGQLAKVWREHAHFTSHVIARYWSQPFDWVPEQDGTWLVATAEAIWRTSETGTNSLVARLPQVISGANSLARELDGTLYIGMRGAVLRLTPTWPDEPRYASDLLLPPGPRDRCQPATN
jgi:hypothetical protein